jgi:hypothetical protein
VDLSCIADFTDIASLRRERLSIRPDFQTETLLAVQIVGAKVTLRSNGGNPHGASTCVQSSALIAVSRLAARPNWPEAGGRGRGFGRFSVSAGLKGVSVRQSGRMVAAGSGMACRAL